MVSWANGLPLTRRTGPFPFLWPHRNEDTWSHLSSWPLGNLVTVCPLRNQKLESSEHISETNYLAFQFYRTKPHHNFHLAGSIAIPFNCNLKHLKENIRIPKETEILTLFNFVVHASASAATEAEKLQRIIFVIAHFTHTRRTLLCAVTERKNL